MKDETKALAQAIARGIYRGDGVDQDMALTVAESIAAMARPWQATFASDFACAALAARSFRGLASPEGMRALGWCVAMALRDEAYLNPHAANPDLPAAISELLEPRSIGLGSFFAAAAHAAIGYVDTEAAS